MVWGADRIHVDLQPGMDIIVVLWDLFRGELMDGHNITYEVKNGINEIRLTMIILKMMPFIYFGIVFNKIHPSKIFLKQNLKIYIPEHIGV